MMDEKIIKENLEIIRRFLNVNGEEFSTLFGYEKSYYRCVIKNRKVSLEFVVKVCKYCHIKIDRFINERLKLIILFEDDDIRSLCDTNVKGNDK